MLWVHLGLITVMHSLYGVALEDVMETSTGPKCGSTSVDGGQKIRTYYPYFKKATPAPYMFLCPTGGAGFDL